MFDHVEDRELTVLLLGVLVAAFVLAHLRQIRTFPWWPLPLSAGASLLLGWTSSVAEDIWSTSWLNTTEHIFYALHTVLFSTWAIRLAQEGRK